MRLDEIGSCTGGICGERIVVTHAAGLQSPEGRVGEGVGESDSPPYVSVPTSVDSTDHRHEGRFSSKVSRGVGAFVRSLMEALVPKNGGESSVHGGGKAERGSRAFGSCLLGCGYGEGASFVHAQSGLDAC